MPSKVYPGQWSPIPVPDLENWNTDRTPDVPVMVRGQMYKTSGGWHYFDGSTQTVPTYTELAGVTPHTKKYYTNVGAVTDGIVWSPATGKRWYITDLVINTTADCTVTLEDDLTAGDDVVLKANLAAKSGIAKRFNTPLFSGQDGVDLLVTTDAGTIYITVTGYEI